MFLPASILSDVTSELSNLGDKVLSQPIFDAVTDSERHLPYLRGNGRDAFGKPIGDSLVVSEGWTKLQNFGIENGCGHDLPLQALDLVSSLIFA